MGALVTKPTRKREKMKIIIIIMIIIIIIIIHQIRIDKKNILKILYVLTRHSVLVTRVTVIGTMI